MNKYLRMNISTFSRRVFACVFVLAILASCCALAVFAAGPGQFPDSGGRPDSGTSSNADASVNHIDIAIDLTAIVFINGEQKEIDLTLTTNDAQYVTITAEPSDTNFTLSGGVSTSTDNEGNSQIRIEGDFPVGTKTDPVNYTVSLTKTLITEGNTPVDVTLSTTTHYWDSGNVCPGYQEEPGRMSGIDLNLGSAVKGCLLIQKTISGVTLAEPKTFDFQVLDASGNIYRELSITVPAGQSTASVILANLDLGTYTIREVINSTNLDGYDLLSTAYTNGGTAVLSSDNNFVSCNVTNTYAQKSPEHIHSYQAQTISPTCTERGYTVYSCACGNTYEAAEKSPLGHSYSGTVTDPTCTEGGCTEHTCTECGDTYTDAETPAKGHDLSAWGQTEAPSCTENGEDLRSCTRCEYQETREIPAAGHDYSTTVIDPTCTEWGYTIFRCFSCGSSYKAGVKPAAGHNYISSIIPPSIDAEGYTKHTCTNCGDTYKDAITSPLPSMGSLEISVAISNALLLQDTEFTFDVCDETGKLVFDDISVTVQAGSNVGTLCLADIPTGTYAIRRNPISENTFLVGDASAASVMVLANEQTAATFTANLTASAISVVTKTTEGINLSDIELLLEWSADGGVTWCRMTRSSQAGIIQAGQCSSPALLNSTLTSDETGCITFSGLYPGVEYRVTVAAAPAGFTTNLDTVYCDKLLSSFLITSVFDKIPVDDIPKTGVDMTGFTLCVFLLFLSAASVSLFSFTLIDMRKNMDIKTKS